MKREIKFRGLKSNNGKLIYGQLLTNKLGSWIIEDMNPHYCKQYDYIDVDQPIQVIPKTVGEYIGLKDKNGKEIYEGDIIPIKSNDSQDLTQVVFDQAHFFMLTIYKKGIVYNFWNEFKEDIEVIGNIHENPELLK